MSGSTDMVADGEWSRGHANRVFDELASTQDELREWAARGAPHGAVVVARRQTAGRGRQGRTWKDTAPGNLYASVLLRHSSALAQLPSFALAAGLSVRRACGPWHELGLKWPNDLWIDGRKVGGLLLESVGSAAPVVLVGLGLNLREPERGWGELQGIAISFEEVGARPPLDGIVQAWLAELELVWQEFLAKGVASMLPEWERASVLRAQAVEWTLHGESHRGVVAGVGLDGSLRVRLDQSHEVSIHAGEVHLSGVQG